jgi:hypothetical protein
LLQIAGQGLWICPKSRHRPSVQAHGIDARAFAGPSCDWRPKVTGTSGKPGFWVQERLICPAEPERLGGAMPVTAAQIEFHLAKAALRVHLLRR